MNLGSCKCGIVVDMNKIEFIPNELPDNPEDEKFRDKDGHFDMEIEVHLNENLVWPRGDCSPMDTWQCPICKQFNGKGE